MADANKNKKETGLRAVFNLNSGRKKAFAAVLAGGLAVGGFWAAQEMSRDDVYFVRVTQKEHSITRVCAETVSDRTQYGRHSVAVPQEELDAEYERMREARVKRALERGGTSADDPLVERPQPRTRTVVGLHTTSKTLEQECREEHSYAVRSDFDGDFEIAASMLQGQSRETVRDLFNALEPDYDYNLKTFQANPFLGGDPSISGIEETDYTKRRKNGTVNYYDFGM